jgi:uncharacterized protein Yka (UPF0111/DUF47 family)
MVDLLQVGNEMRQTDFYLLMEIVERIEDIADNCDYSGVVIEMIISGR